MIIKLKLRQPDYISLLEKAGPVILDKYIPRSKSADRLIAMAKHIPFPQCKTLLENIPPEATNCFLSALADEQKTKIISILNGLLRKNSINLHVSYFALSPDPELLLTFCGVTYEQFLNELLPLAAEKIPAAKTLPHIISHLPQKAQAQLIKTIIKLAAAFLSKKYGIPVELDSVCIQL